MNILIIGLGSIAQKHIAAIRKIAPSAVVYALRSGENINEQPDVISLHAWEGIRIQPDFIIISNPTRLHEETIRRSFAFGCPLFIEKPALADLANAADILEDARNKGIMTYVACNLRFHPVIGYLKQFLTEKNPRINEVNVYCGSYLPEWRPDKDFRKIYSANASMGGGVHLDLIHELDYCHWLFGKPRLVSSVKKNLSSLGIDAVDFAAYLLEYPQFTVTVTLNYYRRDSKRTIEILTEEDTIVADLNANKVTAIRGNNVLFNETFDIMTSYHDQLSYFLDHLNGHTQPMNGLGEAIEVLKTVLT